MIYTLTLNPAVDRFLVVERFVPDDVNRVVQEVRYAGGKGINVSRVIKELGGESIALGLVGGFDGQELEGRLLNDGIHCAFTPIAGETRTNVHVHPRRGGKHTTLNARGPRITPTEVGALFDKLRTLRPTPRYVVMSGSLPQGVRTDIYAQITRQLGAREVRVVLDADDEPLRKGIAAKPFLVKPNRHELGRLFRQTIQTPAQALPLAQKLHQRGISYVVVSLGKEGFLVVCLEGSFRVIPPDVPVQSAVGAGDSLVGGLVLALSRGELVEEALRLAGAASAAAVMTSGTELCRAHTVRQLIRKVKIEVIK